MASPLPFALPLALAEGHVDQLAEDIVLHGLGNLRACGVVRELGPLQIQAGGVHTQGLVEDLRLGLAVVLADLWVVGRERPLTITRIGTIHGVRKRTRFFVHATVTHVRRLERTRPIVGKVEHEHAPRRRAGDPLAVLAGGVEVSIDNGVRNASVKGSLDGSTVDVSAGGQDDATGRALRLLLKLAGHRLEVGRVRHAAVEAGEVPTLRVFLAAQLALGGRDVAEGVRLVAGLVFEQLLSKPLVIVGGGQVIGTIEDGTLYPVGKGTADFGRIGHV